MSDTTTKTQKLKKKKRDEKNFKRWKKVLLWHQCQLIPVGDSYPLCQVNHAHSSHGDVFQQIWFKKMLKDSQNHCF